MPSKKTNCLVILMMTIQGCMLPLSERQSGQSIKATEQLASQISMQVKAAMETMKPPMFSVTNSTGSVQFPVPSKSGVTVTSGSNVNAGSEEDIETWKITSIPFGVKMILAAIGIGGLIFVAKWGVNQSAAAKAVLKTVDTSLASKIRAKQSLMGSVSAEEKDRLYREIHDLESERGKIASGKI